MIQQFFLLLIATCLAHTTFGQIPQGYETAQPPKWTYYKQAGYEIGYPASWELNTSGLMGSEFIILSPQNGADDRFRENVNMIIQELGVDMTLREYAAISEQQIKSLMEDGVILESEIVSGERDYYYLAYAAKQGDFVLTFMAYCWIIEQKAYLITFTAEKDQFEAVKPLAARILNGFTLKI